MGHFPPCLIKRMGDQTEMINDYTAFLERKAIIDPPTGLAEVPALNQMLMPFQRDMVTWALRRGRAAIFADCGLGKTFMELEWSLHTPPGLVLILTTLAVARQTLAEANKFGIPGVTYARSQEQVHSRITVTNYEMLSHFDPSAFIAVVLDESAIIKSHDGKTRAALIEAFAQTPFRLACTATPAPNDYMELGNHAQFLGIMSYVEMLSTFFVHDGGETNKWRLKGHALSDFWTWLCSWAVMIRKPSDLGYSDGGFILPPLCMHESIVPVERATDGYLFPVEALTLQERIGARRASIDGRVAECAKLVNATDDAFLVWCNLNSESEALTASIPGAVEVRGSDSLEEKEAALSSFSEGRTRVLVTKPSIAGHGLNWQHCHNMAFVGLSDSWEQLYQATRRCWRFGQRNPVNVHIICAETEGAVLANIKRKEADALQMAESMVEHMRDLNEAALRGAIKRTKDVYEPTQRMRLPAWI